MLNFVSMVYLNNHNLTVHVNEIQLLLIIVYLLQLKLFEPKKDSNSILVYVESCSGVRYTFCTLYYFIHYSVYSH